MGYLFFLLLLPLVIFAYECTVEKVIDGDTFLCSGDRVRLIGIDTPESSYNPRVYKQRSLGDARTVVELGRRAKRFTEELIPPGTRVRLELGVQERDRYGRLLAYVWLPDGRMLNEVLLREGYAMILTIPPNVKYLSRFREAYRYAVENRKGLWAVRKRLTVPEGSLSRCGAKRFCSQMISCEEALFYYRVCGLKRLDGDGDGIPCERLCR
ncbi:thermonuclease family protein [Hydrogenivirga sp.]